ncbi:hypothetical protein C8F01DRAFT_102071 [Mycena amicta]|nr:hypothetical protein C8F01DRAFT_102071 [Mycena amicta]
MIGSCATNGVHHIARHKRRSSPLFRASSSSSTVPHSSHLARRRSLHLVLRPHLAPRALILISRFGHSSALRALAARPRYVLRALVFSSLSLVGCWCFGHSSSFLSLSVCASGTRLALCFGHSSRLVLRALVTISRFGRRSSSLVWPCTSGASHVVSLIWPCTSGAGHRLAVYFGCQLHRLSSGRVLRVPVTSSSLVSGCVLRVPVSRTSVAPHLVQRVPAVLAALVHILLRHTVHLASFSSLWVLGRFTHPRASLRLFELHSSWVALGLVQILGGLCVWVRPSTRRRCRRSRWPGRPFPSPHPQDRRRRLSSWQRASRPALQRRMFFHCFKKE